MTLNQRIAKARGWLYRPDDTVTVGGHRTTAKWVSPSGAICSSPPNWSGSIADAWELVEEMRDIGAPKWKQFTDALEHEVDRISPEDPDVGFFRHPVCDLMWYLDPEIICLAWLAVMERQE